MALELLLLFSYVGGLEITNVLSESEFGQHCSVEVVKNTASWLPNSRGWYVPFQIYCISYYVRSVAN